MFWMIIRWELIACLFVIVLSFAQCIRIPRKQAQIEPRIPTQAEDWDAEFLRLTGQPAFPPPVQLNQWTGGIGIQISAASASNCVFKDCVVSENWITW